ncbi:MAG: DUF3108 domain-containing protein [Gemmatimonadaceae bacterium]
MLRLQAVVRSAFALALMLGAPTLANPALGNAVYAQGGVQGVSDAGAQPASDQTKRATNSPVLTVPFGVGERMDYDVRFLGGKKGEGSMEVREITDVRGRKAWHTVFKVAGRVLLLGVNITLESWFDVSTLNSLRFFQDQRYTGTKKVQHIDIFPERGMYKEDALEERVTVSNPLDDGSFLYFVRSVPLEVGQKYSFQRYYKPDKNPVKIEVIRRETVTTSAGTFRTLVLRPEIKAGGLFAEGKSQVWITDDSARMVVKLESELPVGTLSLWLTKFRLGKPHKP